MINKIVSYIMVICLFCAVPQVVFADETVITSPHAVLMEASTGKIKRCTGISGQHYENYDAPFDF